MELAIYDFRPRGAPVFKWNQTLHDMLRSSGRFTVCSRPCPYQLPDNVVSSRESCISFLSLAGCDLMLDTWDCDWPTSLYVDRGVFGNSGALSGVKMVLKIQYRPHQRWVELKENTGVVVTPWSMFPTSNFPLGAFRWQNGPHRYLLTTSGHTRRGRGEFQSFCAQQGDCYAPAMGVKEPVSAYIQILMDCTWGLSLKGRSRTDGKNRREPEFTSCGLPLALNYRPHYPFPFEPDRDYVFLRRPDDVLRLREIDPAPFAERSSVLWKRYFSPRGMADLLIQLVTQHLGLTLHTQTPPVAK